MGDKDFVKPLLESRGTVHFGKVCMKPGKPLTFATICCGPAPSGAGGMAAAARQLLVFGLPGNPVSSLVTFTLVVLPCLRKLAGWQVLNPKPSTPFCCAAARGGHPLCKSLFYAFCATSARLQPYSCH